jgi:hypothetical protein
MRDRLSYYGAGLLALAVGALAAVVLYVASPPHGEPMRSSPFDTTGRVIGPIFLALGVAALVQPTLLRRLVRPGPLVHLLHKANRRRSGIDTRPAYVWIGLIIGSLAVLFHAGMRELHTTFDSNGVRWRDWPWQQDEVRPWSELCDLVIVHTFKKKSGKVRKRSHLDLTFRDGTQVLTGRDHSRRADLWEAPAAFASQRSGVAVHRVER